MHGVTRRRRRRLKTYSLFEKCGARGIFTSCLTWRAVHVSRAGAKKTPTIIRLSANRTRLINGDISCLRIAYAYKKKLIYDVTYKKFLVSQLFCLLKLIVLTFYCIIIIWDHRTPRPEWETYSRSVYDFNQVIEIVIRNDKIDAF